MLKLKYILITVLVLVTLVTGGLMQMQKLKPTSSTKYNLSISVQLIDRKNKPILNSLKTENNNFKGDFLIRAATNQDTHFDVVLIKNFKQVAFSIDNASFQIKHSLFIPKTEGKTYYSKKIKIEINDIDPGINDCTLVLLRKEPQSEVVFKKRNTRRAFATRFSIHNESLIAQIPQIICSQAYQVVKGEIPHSIFVFERPFKEITNNHFANYELLSLVDNLKVGEEVTLHACFSTKKSIENSPFFERYLKDEKEKIKQQVAVVALLDGELYPLNYSSKEKLVSFFKVELGQTIMVSPRLKINEKGLHRLNLLVLSYPYSNPEQLIGTYKMTNWSTIIISNEILVNVI